MIIKQHELTYVFPDDEHCEGRIAEISVTSTNDFWVTIGHVGSDGSTIVDKAEWNQYVNFIKEIDRAVSSVEENADLKLAVGCPSVDKTSSIGHLEFPG